jgi:hypothetical protein
MLELLELSGLSPNPLQDGFSAFLSALSTAASVQLTGWTVTSPYFTTANFNAASGNYTVPVTGLYSIQATTNYITNSIITASIGANVNPAIAVRRTSSSATNLITGLFPLINVNIALLTLRAVLGGGAITTVGEVKLTAGDTVQLFYDADAMTVALTLQNTVWSVYRLA